MKTLRRFATGLLASILFASMAFSAIDPASVETIATDPAIPVIDQPVTIYVNLNTTWKGDSIYNRDTVTV